MRAHHHRHHLHPTCPLAENKDVGEALEAFIKAEKLPAFTEFSQETSQAIFGSGINNQVRRGARWGARAHLSLRDERG